MELAFSHLIPFMNEVLEISDSSEAILNNSKSSFCVYKEENMNSSLCLKYLTTLSLYCWMYLLSSPFLSLCSFFSFYTYKDGERKEGRSTIQMRRTKANVFISVHWKVFDTIYLLVPLSEWDHLSIFLFFCSDRLCLRCLSTNLYLHYLPPCGWCYSSPHINSLIAVSFFLQKKRITKIFLLRHNRQKKMC